MGENSPADAALTIPRVKVLDLSTHWSGSMASRHLVHFGADVVKLENPKFGDGNRGLAPLIAGEGMSHIVLNVGKRSVALDRSSDDWEAVLRRSVQWADVVIVGSQPEVAMARGIEFKAIAKLNDRIIYCNVSGYGEVGPWANYPLHGLNGDVVAGLVPVETADGLPAASPHYRSVGTTLAGIHAALGILEALRRRDHGAGAQRVSTSVWESSMFWQWRDMTNTVNMGVSPPAYADLGSRYAMYFTADDRTILVCPIERKFWEPFCDLLNLPQEWKEIGAWGKSGMDWGQGRTEERQLIGQRMKDHSLAYWIEKLEAAGVPFSPLYGVDEAARTAQAEAVGVMADTMVHGQDVRVPNIPIHINSLASGLSSTPAGPRTVVSPPTLGQHTEAFLREIGGARAEFSPTEAESHSAAS